jgi:hypothetical protein
MESEMHFDKRRNDSLRLGIAILGLVVSNYATVAEAALPPRQSTSHAVLNGIYVLVDIGNGDSLVAAGSRRDFTAALSNRYINGVYLKQTWRNVEPVDGAYDWAVLDKQVKIAEASGKKIALSLQAGTEAPAWIYAEGAKPFHTVTTEGANGNFCRPQTVPVPWDPVFLKKWTALVAAFGARYARDPEVSEVKISGIDITTNETNMPRSTGVTLTKKKGAAAGRVCKLPNDVANWIAYGYTQAKVFGAWKQIAASFATAFPKQSLTVMTGVHSMPSIGADGRYDPTGAAGSFASDTFLPYGAATFGRRFVAAQNGWRPNHLDPGVLKFAAKTGNPFGWQPSWPIQCREHDQDVHIGTGDCTERLAVQQLFQVGLQTHPTYLELLFPIASPNAYRDLIQQAYTQVMAEPGRVTGGRR